MKKPLILIVEDEEDIHEALKIILSANFELAHAYNGADGLKKAIRVMPDLILMDLKMPIIDGFQLCKSLREDREFDNIPIIVVSAFNSASDRTKAFDLGADDYVTKPFDRVELVSRIQRKLTSRMKAAPETQANQIVKKTKEDNVDIEFRADALSFLFEGKEIQLSSIEFKILRMLGESYMELIAREKILESVWEKQAVSSRLIDPHILSLRNKIKVHGLTIDSVYGKGYILKKL